MSDQTSWRQAALRVGEALATDGPMDYYGLTASAWLTWSLRQIEQRDAEIALLREAKVTAVTTRCKDCGSYDCEVEWEYAVLAAQREETK